VYWSRYPTPTNPENHRRGQSVYHPRWLRPISHRTTQRTLWLTLLIQTVGTQLQEVGREYGTTTGRKRRTGWLDLVQLRYSTQINGYTSINLTKLDVLDDLPEIKVGIKYHHEGIEVPYFPADLKVLEKVEVEYVTLKGWKTKTSDCTVYAQLPAEAKAYVEFIEQLLGVKIEWIGVGPGRDRMLTR
jgi:adenylosuccinate synthase